MFYKGVVYGMGRRPENASLFGIAVLCNCCEWALRERLQDGKWWKREAGADATGN
jgi:hypothetical protein